MLPNNKHNDFWIQIWIWSARMNQEKKNTFHVWNPCACSERHVGQYWQPECLREYPPTRLRALGMGLSNMCVYACVCNLCHWNIWNMSGRNYFDALHAIWHVCVCVCVCVCVYVWVCVCVCVRVCVYHAQTTHTLTRARAHTHTHHTRLRMHALAHTLAQTQTQTQTQTHADTHTHTYDQFTYTHHSHIHTGILRHIHIHLKQQQLYTFLPQMNGMHAHNLVRHACMHTAAHSRILESNHVQIQAQAWRHTCPHLSNFFQLWVFVFVRMSAYTDTLSLRDTHKHKPAASLIQSVIASSSLHSSRSSLSDPCWSKSCTRHHVNSHEHNTTRTHGKRYALTPWMCMYQASIHVS